MHKGFVYIIMGLPGSGKGTQSQHLSTKLGIPHISSGDLLRSAVKQNSPLGIEIKKNLDQGLFVPDDLIWSLVSHRLEEADCSCGAIVDGFPRNLDQAHKLSDFLETLGFDYRVIFLEVSKEQIIRRISSRYICPSCHRVYKQKEDISACSVCHTALVQRSDDDPKVVEQRLEVYLESTVPVIAYYESLGKVARISAEHSEEEVFQSILQCSVV